MLSPHGLKLLLSLSNTALNRLKNVRITMLMRRILFLNCMRICIQSQKAKPHFCHTYNSVLKNVKPMLQNMDRDRQDVFYYIRRWCID